MGETRAISAEGIVKTYGRVEALKGVDLDVARGQVYTILGPNGAGKTTLLRILTTVTRPDAGRASILGFDTNGDALEIRKRMGIVAQQNHFETYFTIEDNLRLHAQLHGMNPRAYEPRIRELLQQVKLYEWRHALSDQLSGGMQRRVALVRALVHEPKILFLDEPTTGLDPVARRQIWDEIRALKEHATVVLTTHYMEEADALSDRILMLDRGQVVMEGTPQELKKQLSPENRYELILSHPTAESYIEKLRQKLPEAARVSVSNPYRLVVCLPEATALSELMDVVPAGELVRLGALQPDLEEVFIAVAKKSEAS